MKLVYVAGPYRAATLRVGVPLAGNGRERGRMKSYEAIKLLLDGKKVRALGWEPSEYWHLSDGVLRDNLARKMSFDGFWLLCESWEEYIEGHDFAWARQQLEAGRAVENLDITGCRMSPKDLPFYVFSIKMIDSKRWALAKGEPEKPAVVERRCFTCLHADRPGDSPPCEGCLEFAHWEPAVLAKVQP